MPSLSITVRGPFAVVPAAACRLLPIARETTTDRQGHASFDDLTPGDYVLSVAAEGYEPSEQAVAVQDDADIDVHLASALLIRGFPDPRSRDEFIAAYSLLALSDLAGAERLWRSNAARRFLGLLGGDGYEWNAEAQSYSSPGGSELDHHDLYMQAMSLIRSVEHGMEDQATDMARGRTELSQWQRWMAETIRDLYAAAGLVTSGGMAAATSDTLEQINGTPDSPPSLKFSLSKLYDFAAGLAAGDAGSAQQIVNRAGMYAEAAHGVAENLAGFSHGSARDAKGRPMFLFERNALMDGTDHCGECPELTEAGWQPIGTLPPPGTRECMAMCKCHLIYNLTGEAQAN